MKQRPVHTALQPFVEGQALLIDKPLHWTSFDVVRKLRSLTHISKIGHAGTLDPLATGLLIVCTGKFTKRVNEFMGMEKEYTGSITLGSSTPTYDLESGPENFKDLSHLTEQDIIAATQFFVGEIMQVPPIHSAIKRDGKPVYLAARKGVDVVLDPRPITIKSFEITGFDLPKIYFKVVCSTGTYIRSLANDLGAKLNVGGHLSSLRRTCIGEFKVDDAQSLEQFEAIVQQLNTPSSEGQVDA